MNSFGNLLNLMSGRKELLADRRKQASTQRWSRILSDATIFFFVSIFPFKYIYVTFGI